MPPPLRRAPADGRPITDSASDFPRWPSRSSPPSTLWVGRSASARYPRTLTKWAADKVPRIFAEVFAHLSPHIPLVLEKLISEWVQFFLSWRISGLTGCFLIRAPACARARSGVPSDHGNQHGHDPQQQVSASRVRGFAPNMYVDFTPVLEPGIAEETCQGAFTVLLTCIVLEPREKMAPSGHCLWASGFVLIPLERGPGWLRAC